jgi:uncharacterized Tic20 family protein
MSNDSHPPSSGPPPLRTHQQPPPGLPSQVSAHGSNPHAPYHPNSDELTMAMLMHLLSLLTGFLAPLILWLVKKEESAFINHHGKESLNFSISVTLYTVGLTIVMMVLGVITFGIGFIVLVPIYFLLIIGFYIVEILACIAASRGEWHRMPLTIRLIP